MRFSTGFPLTIFLYFRENTINFLNFLIKENNNFSPSGRKRLRFLLESSNRREKKRKEEKSEVKERKDNSRRDGK